MRSNYENCYRFTQKWEGGYVNHPKDPGGATNRGVIQRVYDSYRGRRGLAKRSVRYIEDNEVREIYRKQYWDAVRGDDLPMGVDLAVWDFGVNSGPTRAVKYLQKVIGARIDGVIGEATLEALERHDPVDVVQKICRERQSFVRGLRTYKTFGKGWERRIVDVYSTGTRMAQKAVPLPDEITPVPQAPEDPIEDVSPKADGEEKMTRKRGFWEAIGGTLLTGIGTVLGAIQHPAVAITLIVVVAAGIAFYIWKKPNELPELGI